MNAYLKSVPGRLLLAATAAWFGLGGLSIVLNDSAAGESALIAGPLLAIVLVHLGVGFTSQEDMGLAGALGVFAPLVAFATLPVMLIARGEGSMAIGAACVALGVLAAGHAALTTFVRLAERRAATIGAHGGRGAHGAHR
jgi:hypothetical protein